MSTFSTTDATFAILCIVSVHTIVKLTDEKSDKDSWHLPLYLSFDTAKGGGVGLNNVFKHINNHTYQNRNL